jgi:hypothetical protein
MNNHLRLVAPFIAASLVVAGVAFVGCSDDTSSGQPQDPTQTDTGAPRDTEVPMTDSTPGTDSMPGDTGTPPGDAVADGWTLESGVCFPGKPTKMVEYLNKCTTADSVKYTKKLTKLNADGSRPPLP